MEMFCFQCEQTANGTGCTRGGVCGKKIDTALLQDELTSKLVELACAAEGKPHDAETDDFMIDGLFTTITNVNFDDADIEALCSRGDRADPQLRRQLPVRGGGCVACGRGRAKP